MAVIRLAAGATLCEPARPRICGQREPNAQRYVRPKSRRNRASVSSKEPEWSLVAIARKFIGGDKHWTDIHGNVFQFVERGRNRRPQHAQLVEQAFRRRVVA